MPAEYMELALCRELGWTLTELRATSRRDVTNILTMMDVEAQMREARSRVKTR